MTSIPASRSARAMTLAPRSCPSRPGFAMTTRHFRKRSLYLPTHPTDLTYSTDHPDPPYLA
jgi:hypothetical protein